MLNDPNNWMHYHIHIRATLGEVEGNQPLPTHAWSGLPICLKMVSKNESLKVLSWHLVKPSCSLEDDHTKRGSPIPVQGILDSA